MAGRAVMATSKEYAQSLVATLLFPIVWMRSVRFARDREDQDPRARQKALGAIALSVLLAAGALFAVESFRQDAVDGMYDNLSNNLAVATGESQYQEWLSIADAQDKTIGKAATDLDRARAEGNETNVTKAQQKIATASKMRDNALQNASALEGNHQLFLRVDADLARRDDAAARARIEQRGEQHEGVDMDRSLQAFAVKDDAVADMQEFYLWFVYPSLVGIFFAPLVWAMGSILNEGFEPSDSVGFKPYPSGAAALFLLLGAFGVPALFFAAWCFMDLRDRAREGQIAL